MLASALLYSAAGIIITVFLGVVVFLVLRSRTKSTPKAKSEAPSPKTKTTHSEDLIALIQEIIEQEIRPGLQADVGDIDLIDIDGNKVIIAFRGMCTGCLMAGVTLEGIQNKLRELVSDAIVLEVQ